MFVLRSKYDDLELKFLRLTIEHKAQVAAWNTLVEKINKKGGKKFLESSPTASPLSRDDLRKLIALVHPDKHAGSKVAEEMTRKLLELREKL